MTGLDRRNDQLQADIRELDALVDQEEAFARVSEPVLTRGKLAGEEIVIFQFAGTEGGLVDGVRRALIDSGAQLITEITITQKFDLQSAPTRDELSLIVGSVVGDENQLLVDTATLLGERAAASASETPAVDSPSGSVAPQRFQNLVDELEAAEFVQQSSTEAGSSVPQGASFVILGGSSARPPFPVGEFAAALAEGLGGRGSGTIVVEGSGSQWSVVGGVRNDIEARTYAATVDNGDSTIGRVGTVLGLDRAIAGEIGHYGVEPGRTTIIPDPSG